MYGLLHFTLGECEIIYELNEFINNRKVPELRKSSELYKALLHFGLIAVAETDWNDMVSRGIISSHTMLLQVNTVKKG